MITKKEADAVIKALEHAKYMKPKEIERFITGMRHEYKIWDKCPTCGYTKELKGGKKK